MDIAVRALLIGLAFGVVLGIYIAIQSHKEKKVHGGVLAQAFHVLASITFASILPTVIAALILHGGFEVAIPLAFSLVLVTYGLLVLFAVIEHPALALADDGGWTEQDARNSGL